MTSRPDLDRLVAILADVAGPDRTPEPIEASTQLSEGGFWLDSADLLEVVLACEEAFAVSLDPAALARGSELTVGGLLHAIAAAGPH